jgi:hypothetical protein
VTYDSTLIRIDTGNLVGTIRASHSR